MKRSFQDAEVIVLDSDDDEPTAAGGKVTAANTAITPAPTPNHSAVQTTAASNAASADVAATTAAPTNAAFNSFKDIVLAKIYELFPDIGHKYVSGIYDALQNEGRDPDAIEALMVDKIFEKKSYPKETDEQAAEKAEKEREAKRPRLDEGERKNWNENDGVSRDRDYYTIASSYIRFHFPVPKIYADRILREKRTLYAAYLAIEEVENKYDSLTPKPYSHVNNKYMTSPVLTTAAQRMSQLNRPRFLTLVNELTDAENFVKKENEKRSQAAEAERIEEENLARYAAEGSVLECQCCFTESPLNRMITCQSDELHAFCYSCINAYVRSQVGMMKHETKCVASTTACNATFTWPDLCAALEEGLSRKLEHLRQRDDIAAADIEGLSECPFCDFKAICPPVEQDKEFRCANTPACGKVSCRLCKRETHVPLTCKEAGESKTTDARLRVEEAMSEALIRICPNEKCRVPIVKELGCNKMVCVKCQTKMCYSCKADITRIGYDHFKSTNPGYARRANDNVKGCVIYENTKLEELHNREVANAKERAIQEEIETHPDLDRSQLGTNDENDNNAANKNKGAPKAAAPPPRTAPQPPPVAPPPNRPARRPRGAWVPATPEARAWLEGGGPPPFLAGRRPLAPAPPAPKTTTRPSARTPNRRASGPDAGARPGAAGAASAPHNASVQRQPSGQFGTVNPAPTPSPAASNQRKQATPTASRAPASRITATATDSQPVSQGPRTPLNHTSARTPQASTPAFSAPTVPQSPASGNEAHLKTQLQNLEQKLEEQGRKLQQQQDSHRQQMEQFMQQLNYGQPPAQTARETTGGLALGSPIHQFPVPPPQPVATSSPLPTLPVSRATGESASPFSPAIPHPLTQAASAASTVSTQANHVPTSALAQAPTPALVTYPPPAPNAAAVRAEYEKQLTDQMLHLQRQMEDQNKQLHRQQQEYQRKIQVNGQPRP